MRRLEKDRAKNNILGYLGASGPETYEIFKWKSQSTRTYYEVIPVSSIVRVLRATQFKWNEIRASAGNGKKNNDDDDDEIFLVNYLV